MWKDIRDKKKTRPQYTNVGKFSFLNRSISDWNNLPAELFEDIPPTSRMFFFKKKLIR